MKIEDVKGLLPEKKNIADKWFSGFNFALSEIGKKEIVIDVEKIENIINALDLCVELAPSDEYRIAQAISKVPLKVKDNHENTKTDK